MKNHTPLDDSHNHICIEMVTISGSEEQFGKSSWEVKVGFAQTPFGEALIATCPQGICRLTFLDSDNEREHQISETQGMWSKAKIKRDDAEAEKIARMLFPTDKNLQFPTTQTSVKVCVKGTDFQLKVWRALLNIEHGELCTYGEIAKQIKAPKAHRAVGTAIGKNEISYLIPCHRVIQAGGATGNYRWGAERKKAIIDYEINTTNHNT